MGYSSLNMWSGFGYYYRLASRATHHGPLWGMSNGFEFDRWEKNP